MGPLATVARETDLADPLYGLLQKCQSPGAAIAKLRRRWEAIAEQLPAGAEYVSAPDMPADLLGEPAALDPAAYHAECLSTIDWQAESDQRVPLKVRYHLSMLGHALAPTDERFLPLVSIVLTAGHGPGPIDRAIESCLAQTYSKVQVVVVDDGSMDAAPKPLTAPNDVIDWVTAPERDIGSVRNCGLARATGELVLFLGADEELLPDAVADLVAVFARVCDARLCVGQVHAVGGRRAGTTDSLAQPWSAPRPAITGDALLAVASGFPFGAITMMAPRWFIGQVGPFEPDLGCAAATRHWFRMARAGLKALELPNPVANRYLSPGGASRRNAQATAFAIEANLRSIEELAAAPRLYRYIVPLMVQVAGLVENAFDEGLAQAQLDHFHERTLALEARIGRGIASAEGLTAILLDQLLLALQQGRPDVGHPPRPTLLYRDEREGRLRERLARAPRISAADLRRWLPDLPARPYATLTGAERSALDFALEQLQLSVLLGELSIPLRALLRVGADFAGHPDEDFWKGAARLARVVGEENAKRICRQKLFRHGWQWLGRFRGLLYRQGA